MTTDELDIANFDLPMLEKKDLPVPYPVWASAAARGQIASLRIDRIIEQLRNRNQLSAQRRQNMRDDYQNKADEFKQDVMTIRERAVKAYHQYIPPSLRVPFWIVFAVVCLVVGGFIKAVVPFI